MKKEILKKMLRKQEEQKQFKMAIEMKVCPECGEDLTRYRGEFCEIMADSDITYKCSSCGFTHRLNGHAEEGDVHLSENEYYRMLGYGGGQKKDVQSEKNGLIQLLEYIKRIILR